MEPGRTDGVAQAVLESLADGVIVVGPDEDVLFANPSAERMLGIRVDAGVTHREDWLGICFRADGATAFPRDELPLGRALRGETVAGTDVCIRMEGRAPRWISVSGGPLHDSRGRVTGAAAVLRDVTETRARRAERHRLALAVEQTGDGVFMIDGAGRLVYVNPAFLTISGYAREEALGRTLREVGFCADDREQCERLGAAIRSGAEFRGTTSNRRKDGTAYVSHQTITPMTGAPMTGTPMTGAPMTGADGVGGHSVGVCRDMTEHIAVEAQRIELTLASAVQRRLYPRTAPRVEGFDLAGAVFSAEATCGDYFDFVTLPDGRVLMAIGDVSGHGLGPALVMTQVRARLRSTLHVTADVARVVTELHHDIVRDLEESFFVTLLVALLDPVARTLVYVNAGHVPGVVVGADGALRERLSRTGLPLGLFGDGRYSTRQAKLLPGDVVVLMTDGVIEARDAEGQLLDEEGALAVVSSNVTQSSQRIIDRVYARVREQGGGEPLADDVAMVVLRASPRADEDPPKTMGRGAAQRDGTIVLRAN